MNTVPLGALPAQSTRSTAAPLLTMRIAGDLTVADWIVMRGMLRSDPCDRLWRRAFQEFFRGRIASRYLKPIATLRRYDGFHGEGFSIVSLQCALIEFFAATVEGKSYRQRRKGEPPLGEYEYDGSKGLFVRFLHTEPPFSDAFTPETAEEFYVSVRCGLLHEARTRNGWTIRAHSTGAVIDAGKKIVYRNNLQKCLERFVRTFGEDLIRRRDRQAAFIRKFDSLCDF
jgi:hypothetical protein